MYAGIVKYYWSTPKGQWKAIQAEQTERPGRISELWDRRVKRLARTYLQKSHMLQGYEPDWFEKPMSSICCLKLLLMFPRPNEQEESNISYRMMLANVFF